MTIMTPKPKKPRRTPDWHPADIKAAVEKTGWTLARLSAAAGLPAHACRHALHYPYHLAELAIAEAIGVPAPKIWPDRYGPDGETLHPPRRRPDNSIGRMSANLQKEVAA